MPAHHARVVTTASLSAALANYPFQSAYAHAAEPPTPHTIWQSWNLEPWLLISLIIASALYCMGLRRLRSPKGKSRTFQMGCYSAATAMLFIALISPLDALGEALGSAHMLQHMLLFFAAPLLIMSNPLATYLWALPRPWRQGLSQGTRHSIIAPLWKMLSSATFAWTFHAIVLWAWHSPPLYQTALRVPWAHDLEHASFLLSGLLLWWAIIHRTSTGLLLLFTTMLHGGLLAALMTFSAHTWYPYYNEATAAWGLTPLQDQQLAGMVMWVLGGLGYLLAGLGILNLWLQRLESHVLRTTAPKTKGSQAKAPQTNAAELSTATPVSLLSNHHQSRDN